MRLLVVSPIASHPQRQGNSARIYNLCKSLQSLGHLVHFLYYPMEGLTAEQQGDMAACWDDFHTLPVTRQIERPRAGQTYGLDDWSEPALGAFTRQLHDHWRFDAVLVNYVWISAVLDALPGSVPKIIDTHDIFGDRHLSFGGLGLSPEWYYTSHDEERRGLMRADIVVAIQEHEAAHFRAVLQGSATQVAVVGHGVPRRFLNRRDRRSRPTVGYLGSGNPFNVSSVRRLVSDLAAAPELRDQFRFLLAGAVCERFPVPPTPFESVGMLPDVEDFYDSVDLVVNPMAAGTGLKIKTLEGLSFGLPVLGTEDAWAGICEPRDLLPEARSTSVVDGLRAVAAEPGLLDRLRERCRLAFLTYMQHELGAVTTLLDLVSQLHASRRADAA